MKTGGGRLSPPHIPEKGRHHAGQKKIDYMVGQGRNIGAIKPLHPGKRKSGENSSKYHPHQHADTTVQEDKTQAHTQNYSQRLVYNFHIFALCYSQDTLASPAAQSSLSSENGLVNVVGVQL
jgi:hypothetical protein